MCDCELGALFLLEHTRTPSTSFFHMDSEGNGSFLCSASCSLCDGGLVTCALRASSGKRASRLDQTSSRVLGCDVGKMVAPGSIQNHTYCCPSKGLVQQSRLCDS